jgi:hypothetical protein
VNARTKLLLGGVLGSAAGYAYYHFIGCKTGACPITGNPWISTLYGLLIGLLLTFPSKKKGKKSES